MRACDGCRVCCTTPSIEELSKPAWMPCPHECETGCGAYATRPATCRDYVCLWLTGELPELAHPTRTGLMASRGDPKEPTIAVMEARPGASESYWGWRLVKWLARKAAVVVTAPPGSKSGTYMTGRARKAVLAASLRDGESWPR